MTFRTGLSAVNGAVYHTGRSHETWLSEDFRIKCTIYAKNKNRPPLCFFKIPMLSFNVKGEVIIMIMAALLK